MSDEERREEDAQAAGTAAHSRYFGDAEDASDPSTGAVGSNPPAAFFASDLESSQDTTPLGSEDESSDGDS